MRFEMNGRNWIIGSAHNLFEAIPTSDPGDRTRSEKTGESFPMEKHTAGHSTGSARLLPGSGCACTCARNGAEITAWHQPDAKSYHRATPHSYSNQDQKVM